MPNAECRIAGARAGLTLIEVMMALAIVGIGLVTLISAASQCLAVVQQSRSYEVARNLLTRVELEEPLQLKEEIREEIESGSFTGEYSEYRWTREIEMVGDNEEDGLYKVTMRVYWSRRGKEFFDEIVTYVYAPEEKKGGTVTTR